MSKEITVIRHFEDEDDLRYRLDSPLKKGQEEQVVIATRKNIPASSNVYMLTSPKRRAIETAKIIANELLSGRTTVKLEIVDDLREQDQGEFILPNKYRPGDRFHPLTKAWEKYWQNTFDLGDTRYRFGSGQSEFIRLGECYEEWSLRICRSVKRIYSDRINLSGNVLLAVVTHGAPQTVMLQIHDICSSGDFKTLRTGTLFRECWDRYTASEYTPHDAFGSMATLDCNGIEEEHIKYLVKEMGAIAMRNN